MLCSLCKWKETQVKQIAPFQGNDYTVCPLIMYCMTFLHKVEKDPGPPFPKDLQKLLINAGAHLVINKGKAGAACAGLWLFPVLLLYERESPKNQ